jgi:dihydroflavonol-4-reductase
MEVKRRVFVVGGTGFLGYHTIQEFLKEGWEATALGLPPAPPANFFPAGVQTILRDLDIISDEELISLMRGHEALVFAAGLDDRYTPHKPAYPKFHHANVEIPVRVLRLAVRAGVNHAVVFGSYFAYFDRLWPEMKLAERHPYIRSRVEQELAVTTLPGLDVGVLELPYIFGDPLGRRPLWYPLIKYIRSAPLIFYTRGGTACISAKTVGKAAFGAIEQGQSGTCYPIGQENLTWTQMLERIAQVDKRKISVAILPGWMIKLGMFGVSIIHKLEGREAGLNFWYFSQLQTAETFLNPHPSQDALGYTGSDLDAAFRETVLACNL